MGKQGLGIGFAHRYRNNGVAGERYSLNTLFSEWATPVTDPTNILDVVIGAMDPNWFESAEYETRSVPHGIAFQLGGGLKLGRLLMLAAEAELRQSRTDGKSGHAIWRYSRSDPFPVLAGRHWHQ